MTLWTLTDLRTTWRSWLTVILARFKQSAPAVSIPETPPPAEPETPPLPPPQPEQAAPESSSPSSPPPDPEPAIKAAVSREFRRKRSHEYHRLLRARLKFDKFVSPKGERPVRQKKERPESAPKPKRARKPEPEEVEPPPPPDPNDRLIWAHYDENPDNPEVLYEQSEFWGQYNFRDTILDQLDRYWFYLERMKRHDADSFGFYQKVGMHMVPYLSVGAIGKLEKGDRKMSAEDVEAYKKEITLPPAFKVYRPGFGCVAFGSNPKVEEWEKDLGGKSHFPRFLYYTKYKGPPPCVQRLSGGDIYALTIWYDDYINPKNKWGVPNTFPVFVSRDGEHIKLLKTQGIRYDTIKRKKKWVGHRHDFSVPKRGFYVPEYFERWAEEFGIDAETHLTHVFCYAVKVQESAQLGDIRVSVSKGDLTAIFSVSSRRMAYFFQDRDIELTDGGMRKRLFHVVRPHIRKDGVAVKMHYRGERKFTWAGYEVEVSVPGRDHFIQHEMNVGAWDEDAMKKKVPYLTLPEFGEKIVEMMDQGVGGLAPPRR